ncbi:MAG: cytochrome c peroxidase [Methyloligellaceae bacterium]
MAVSAAFTALFAAVASAHIVTETPWHPVAASYRTMMFLGDLKPVPWNKIRASFVEPHPAAYGTKSARAKLIELDGDAGESASSSILRAIKAQDRLDLYGTATRALSQAVRHHLRAAAAGLKEPSAAARHVASAQELYRALDPFIRQSDAKAYRSLGRAWLTMTSSVGSAGVLGNGKSAPDKARFDAARKVIDDYLIANFEPERFAPRKRLTPLPEKVVAAGGGVRIAPWLPPGSNLNDQNPLPRLVLNFEKRGIKESDLPLAAYGDMLFDSPNIFGEPARSLGVSCSTCHNRGDVNRSLFIPGISHQAGAMDVDGEFFNSLFNDRRNDSLDTPSLRGIRFTGPYGRDGRFGSLRNFTRNVIVNEFGGKEPTPFMLDALVAYQFEFDFLPNSKIDGQGHLTAAASDAARRGETLFRKPFAQMDGKSCASCHVPSASFLDRRAHDIGSGTGGYAHSRDAAFDTPTLLGARFTAPYFHDGSLPTLASVVDWFNTRYKLQLSDTQRSDLTAYLDAVGDADDPYEVYAGRHTPFRLAFEELTTFATTLDTLLPARDTFHAKLLIDTVATDLAADASGMANLAAKPKVYELAAALAGIGKAIDQSDWDEAKTRWGAFKELQEKYDEAMY